MTNATEKLAKHPDDVFRNCDPNKPLAADDEQWYVDLSDVRGTQKLVGSIARSINRSESAFHQQLVTGHRGCGKSTELLRLKAALEAQQFFVIYLDVEDVIDLTEINYQDLLLAIVREVEKQVREHGFTLDNVLLDDLYQWFIDKILQIEQETDFTAEIQAQVQAGSGISLVGQLLTRLTADIKTASSRRLTTRWVLERELPVFVDKLNALIGAVRQRVQSAGYQDIVIIVDGLEKMQYRLLADNETSTHDMLFLHHAEQLKAPRCHLIYTVPIYLAFNRHLRDVFDIFMIPMVKTDEAGLTKLIEIIERRVDVKTVFSPVALLRQLVELSGGAVRDLMHLMRMASDTDGHTITEAEVHHARQTLIKEYDRTLRNEDIDAVRQISQERRVQADKRFERLLNLRIVLEYENGERRVAIHPAVLAISWVKKQLNNDREAIGN